jgi:hypothetical protein
MKTENGSQDSVDSQISADHRSRDSHPGAVPETAQTQPASQRSDSNKSSQQTTDSQRTTDHELVDNHPAAADIRTGLELQAAALMATCDQCWAYPGRLCKFDGGEELHLGRYERANRKGVITDEELKRAKAMVGERNYVIWED